MRVINKYPAADPKRTGCEQVLIVPVELHAEAKLTTGKKSTKVCHVISLSCFYGAKKQTTSHLPG